MEVHIYSVKAKSQAGNQRDNNTRLEILKIYAFCQKNQQRASGSGESTAGVTYLSMRIPP